jgi:hypothetical protein
MNSFPLSIFVLAQISADIYIGSYVRIGSTRTIELRDDGAFARG